jgi:hypothetical protein
MISTHDVIAAYRAAAEARGWNAFGALLADDVITRPRFLNENIPLDIDRSGIPSYCPG